jgi:hypothetical protein
MAMTQTWARNVWRCGLIVFVGLAWARGAAAQVDVDSLPGDLKGEKIAFQRNVGIVVGPLICGKQFDIALPAGNVTIETVTASLGTQAGVVPSLSLHTVVGGVGVDHYMSLTAGPTFTYVPNAATAQSFEATHAVRLHHVSLPNQPLGVSVSAGGGLCEVLGVVTVAGYYRPRPARH